MKSRIYTFQGIWYQLIQSGPNYYEISFDAEYIISDITFDAVSFARHLRVKHPYLNFTRLTDNTIRFRYTRTAQTEDLAHKRIKDVISDLTNWADTYQCKVHFQFKRSKTEHPAPVLVPVWQ